MKRIRYRIRKFFGFSKKETNGFLFLIAFMIILLMAPLLMEIFYKPQNISQEDNVKLDSLISVLNYTSIKEQKVNFVKQNPSQLFYFDPNSVSEEDLKKIFKEKTAKTIVRFRDKGGKFFIKNDLMKIYGMNVARYKEVEKFILLPDEKNNFKQEVIHKSPVAIHLFNINTVDTTELQKLKGIGKVLSIRIIKYRNILGGFISVDQYREVFGLDTTVISELKKRSFIENDFIPKKLNVNIASASSLASHPYIGRKYANVIVAYRDQHKKFNSLDDLKLIRSLPSNEIMKMLPYLEL